MKIAKEIIDLLAKCEVEGKTLKITEQLTDSLIRC